MPSGTWKEAVGRLRSDIRFWIALAFLVRLYGITDPPLETCHHWRQTSVAMVARNLVTDGFDVLHPRMDTAGTRTGITGMEFPLLNALIAFCITVLGPAHWYGRLIVLVLSSLAIAAFHRLIARHLGQRTALHAAWVLLVSLWFMYGRKMMPDLVALSLVMMGIERTEAVYRDRAGAGWLPIGLVLAAAGALCKPTAACLLAAWPVLAFHHGHRKMRLAAYSLGIASACVPAVWWYAAWVPHLVRTYGYWHFFMGKPIAQGAMELWNNLGRTLDNFYFDALRFSGFGLFAYGCYRLVRDRMKAVLLLMVLVYSAFLLTMLKAGDTFWVHAYYVLPIIPLMALIAGIGSARLRNVHMAGAWLLMIAIEGLTAQANDFRPNADQAPLLGLAADLDATRDATGLVAINSGNVPTPMYFADRRGWTVFNGQLTAPGALDSLACQGCTRIVILKRTYEQDVALSWPVLLERDAYRIHGPPPRRLRTNAPQPPGAEPHRTAWP
jgi:4-amino-4-deoxy-L-arabinose transferase-like glycosyltransferase